MGAGQLLDICGAVLFLDLFYLGTLGKVQKSPTHVTVVQFEGEKKQTWEDVELE
jgi:hypothetical protein